MSEGFAVLFVCTANICRSRIAAALAQRTIRSAGPEAAGLVVASAGVEARPGAPIDPRAGELLAAFGAPPDGFRARRLTGPLVEGAQLVLTAERRHRAAAVALHPRAGRRAFTILEFARLAEQLDPGRLPRDGVVRRARALVHEAARLRGLRPPAPGGDDLPDPYGRAAGDYLACIIRTGQAIERPLRLILG